MRLFKYHKSTNSGAAPATVGLTNLSFRHCPYGWEGLAEEVEGKPGDRPDAQVHLMHRNEREPRWEVGLR